MQDRVAAHKQALRKLYAEVAPSKASNVDRIWGKHGAAVWRQLQVVYGDRVLRFTSELEDVSLAPSGDATGTDGANKAAAAKAAAQAQAEAEAAAAAAEAKAAAAAAEATAPAEPAADKTRAAATTETQQAASVAQSPDAEAHKAALRRLYAAVCPDKAGNIDKIWSTHGVRVWKLLQRKYGDQVLPFTESLPDVSLAPTTAGAASDTAGAPTPAPAPAPAPAAATTTSDTADVATGTGAGGDAGASSPSGGDAAAPPPGAAVVAEVPYMGGSLRITMWGCQDMVDPDTQRYYAVPLAVLS